MSAMLNQVVNGGGVSKVGQEFRVGSAMSPEPSSFQVIAPAVDAAPTPTSATTDRSTSSLLAELPSRLFPIRKRPSCRLSQPHTRRARARTAGPPGPRSTLPGPLHYTMNAPRRCPSDADEDVNLPVNRVRRATRRPTGPRRLTVFLAAWLLACVGVCLGALPAHASAGGLLATNPEGGQQLDDPPGSVTLAFDGKVDHSVAKVLVLDAKGNNVTAGPLIVEATNVTTQLED